MFENDELFGLPEDVKVSMIKALLSLAGKDGAVDLSESGFIQRVIEDAGLTDSQFDEARKVFREKPTRESLLEPIKAAGKGRLLIQQLLLLAHVDGEYHSNEKAVIQDSSAYFGFDKEWFETIEKWAQEGSDWWARGMGLLGG